MRVLGWTTVLMLSIGMLGCDPGHEDDESGSGSGSDSVGDSQGGDSQGGDDEIPSSEYCQSVQDWDPVFTEAEEEVLLEVNAARSRGADCGGQGFGSTHPLTMNGALRCAARLHSRDMAQRDFFDHTNPDGEDPFTRMERAGYRYFAAGENIAAGYPTPKAVVEGWLQSPGHCRNIMNPDFTEIGVGYWDPGALWTQTFGRPQ